ncbi:MAG TPA: lipopolysaccharide biosynthesis protein, partial [Terriglobales bacterium]
GARAQGELIAAESELRGLQEIYAPTSVKVQAAQARIAELKRQLQKMSGTTSTDQNSSVDELYPPLRKLPLLGVRYYELVRRARIQESVFEALTKQFEIARVQEAREIPTVKVLDQADVPEKKSFPPRIVIILLGTLCCLSMAAGWIVLQRWWQLAEGVDARRALAGEIWERTSRSGFMLWRRRRP